MGFIRWRKARGYEVMPFKREFGAERLEKIRDVLAMNFPP
jgi:hypothetical protein